MTGIRNRVSVLERVMQTQQPTWVFILVDGTQFYPAEFPVAYLLDHGPLAPDGRRIIRCEHPASDSDVLRAIFATVDAWIAQGKAPWDDDC